MAANPLSVIVVPDRGRRGLWLNPGQATAELTLLTDGLVTFKSRDQLPSKSHGQYKEWENSNGQYILSVVFNYKGNDSLESLRIHLLGMIVPGVYRCSYKNIVFIIPDEMWNADSTKAFLLGDEMIDANTKHQCLWLHPGKLPAFVFLLNNNTVVFQNMGRNSGQPNGYYEYDTETTEWLTYFHHSGDAAPTIGTVLASVQGKVWRAIGDNHREVPLDELKPWHIVAIFF